MKIFFVSPRPFGLMGTPGTYLLVESYARFANIRVVASGVVDDKVAIVHAPNPSLDLRHVDFTAPNYLDQLASLAADFDPDIVCMTNSSLWPAVIQRLKRTVPDAKFVLDIKSPYIWNREAVRNNGARAAPLLDLVLSRSKEDIEGWIPGCTRPSLIYPLGLPIAHFTPRKSDEEAIRSSRFVFIGSYSAHREIDAFLRLVGALPEGIRKQVTFDMFGSGPAKDDLVSLTQELRIDDIVKINDALSQRELLAVLPNYEVGIAWVPSKTFDAAPSLKMLEYIAAGLLPLGTATAAHRRDMEEGYAGVLFEETDPATFTQAIEKLLVDGYSSADIRKNLELIKSRDWDEIVKRYMLPSFEALLAGGGERSGVSLDTDDVFDRMLFWSPAEPAARITPPPPSPLRVAAIVGARLFDGLVDEVQLAVLTPQSWFYALRFGQPDMLLVESTWFTCTGDWHMAQSVPGAERDELREIVAFARKLGIPTVFWMTVDAAYTSHFAEFARAFDFVFCADGRAVELLAAQRISAGLLPPAFQPRRFNPITTATGAPTFGIIYDGWTDIYKRADVRNILQNLGPEYLSIIETGAMIPRSHVTRIQDPKLRGAIRGSVHASLLPTVYKHARASISFTQTSISPTEAAWRALEVAACRVPLAHLGSLPDGDLRSEFVDRVDTDQDFLELVAQLRSDPIKRDKAAHKAWRFAHRANTFEDRIASICAVTGVRYEQRKLPKAVIVTATMRAQLLEKCIRQFSAQTYPNKHLVIVFNGNAADLESTKDTYGSREDITFTTMPTDFQAGCSLNYGAKLVTGDYFFRVDDDDHYGDNYIADCMLHLRACDADFFGKRASFLHFEGDDKVFLRKRLLPDISGFPARDLQSNQETWISGCSFACKLDLLRAIRYPDGVNFAADTELVSRIRAAQPDAQCLLLDNLNLVVERSADVTSHTWQSTAEQLQSGSQVLSLDIADLMV